jgi:hypothetical protein
MCRKVTCNTCGKPTWAGCGAHVEQVLRDVPEMNRCHCRSQTDNASGGSALSQGFLARLFGK